MRRMLFMLLILSVIIVTHEFGHFFAMRACGVPVKEVAVGFGPEIARTTLPDGTPLTLRAIPLGGYTQPDMTVMEAQPLPHLLLIDLGGMLVDVLLGFLAYVFATSFWRDTAKLLGIGSPLWWSFKEAFGKWVLLPPVFIWGLLTAPRGMLARMAGPIGLLTGVLPENPDGPLKEKRPPIPLGFGLVMMFAELNIMIAAFNLLPIAPLDGGMAVAETLGTFVSQSLATGYVVLSMAMFAVLVLIVFVADFVRLFRANR